MKILVLGAGALGSWITANLAIDLRNKAQIYVLDFDKVEQRNWQVGTQFYRSEQRGMLKVDALAFNIYKWLGVKIDVIAVKLGPDSIVLQSGPKDSEIRSVWDVDLVVDTFDNSESRKMVRLECERRKLSCIHIGFSPQKTFEICWNENYDVPDDVSADFDICTAEGARSFIQYVAGFASSVIQSYLENKEKISYVGNGFSIKKIE